MKTEIKVIIWDIIGTIDLEDYIMNKTDYLNKLTEWTWDYVDNQNKEMLKNLDYNFK